MRSPGLFLFALLVAAPRPAAAAPVWVAPLPPPLRVVRAFDPPAVRWAAGHRGVDLAGTPAATVRSAGAGFVAFAGPLAGRGVVVVVHGSLRTTYEPVTAAVQVGDLVGAGDPVGVLQAGHDPAHPASYVLHWGLLRGAVYLDPMSLLSTARPVRLLPRWGSTGTPSWPPEVSTAMAAVAREGPLPTPPTGHGLRVGTTALAAGVVAIALAAVSRRPP